MNKKILWLLIAVIFVSVSSAQGISGEWKEYMSYTQAFKVANGGEKIYCATKGGLFYYNTTDNSVNKISRLSGLSDFDIQTIAYSNENKLLMVAYTNSNIDLVYDNKVVNLSDIKRKAMTGDKTINNIFFLGNDAYLACGFGIVVINLQKQEVKDTYLIGENGSQLQVNDITVKDNIIYAATEKGLYFADLNNPNLLDYNNWSHVDNIPHADERFTGVEVFAGNLIAHYSTGISFSDNELYIQKNGAWERYQEPFGWSREISASENFLTITGFNSVSVFDKNDQVYLTAFTYPGYGTLRDTLEPMSAFYSENTGLWIADDSLGLINAGKETYESIYPNGPVDNNAFFLYSNGTDLWVAPGGVSNSWNNTWKSPQFQLYRDGEWSLFTKKEIPGMSGFRDILCMVADPKDKDHVFVGSWGGGLLEFKNGQLINRFTQKNSSLQTALPDSPDEPYVRVGGLAYDSKGNLWISNSEVPDELSVLYANGEWKAFGLPEIAEKTTGPLIVTQNDDKWIVAPRGNSIYVLNADGSQGKYLPVKSYFNNGETELITDMNDVYSIAVDLNGAVWVGTSKGAAVYFNPERIWEPSFLYASHPGLNTNDGLYHPLLETEKITSIAVDGADRKWMGTASSGIYLISEDGEEEIQHFTTDNSPLLSNSITSIAINQKSGEIFIGTDKGIVSYQGDATGGTDNFKNVLVYPNPVRETYNGPVIITGLTADADVKITDISGNLVFKTTSLGGQATWDGLNLNGNRVKTGVYLIFLSDKNGEKTHISKLLFIN